MERIVLLGIPTSNRKITCRKLKLTIGFCPLSARTAYFLLGTYSQEK